MHLITRKLILFTRVHHTRVSKVISTVYRMRDIGHRYPTTGYSIALPVLIRTVGPITLSRISTCLSLLHTIQSYEFIHYVVTQYCSPTLCMILQYSLTF